MSDSIGLKPVSQTPSTPPNPEPATVDATVPNTDFPTSANGNENGGTYFELNWQTGQGQNLQQNLLTTYHGDETATDTPVYNSGGITPRTIIYGSGGNSNAPGVFNYADGNSSDNNLYGYNNNSVQTSFGDVNLNAAHSLYSTNAAEILSPNDSVNSFSDEPNLADFRAQNVDVRVETRRIYDTEEVEKYTVDASFGK